MKAMNMARCALFASLLVICSWIALPAGDIAFTMQTFGVFLTLGLLGGKWGGISILVYLLLGAAGLPVFAGFRGGLGVLLGATGGYLWGFLVCAAIFWLVTALLGQKRGLLPGMVLGQLACYLFCSLWYNWGYLSGDVAGFAAAVTKCVLPYVLPDCAKLLLAWLLTKKLRRFVY